MKSIAIGCIALFVGACGTAGTEPVANSEGELSTVPTEPGAICPSAACIKGTRPVSDEEVFAIAVRYDANTPTDASTVRLAEIECAEIRDGCQPASCFVRLMCGGRRPVMGADGVALENWLRFRSVPAEIHPF